MTKLERFQWLKQKGYRCTEDGSFYNKKNQKLVKAAHKTGYILRSFIIKGKMYNYYLHQFIWWYFYGEVAHEIDHINGIRDDNRLVNLRSVTRQQNCFNKKGTKGYYFDKWTRRWRAVIRLNYKTHHIGRYDTEEEARIAYLTEKNKLHKYDTQQHSSNSSD